MSKHRIIVQLMCEVYRWRIQRDNTRTSLKLAQNLIYGRIY